MKRRVTLASRQVADLTTRRLGRKLPAHKNVLCLSFLAASVLSLAVTSAKSQNLVTNGDLSANASSFANDNGYLRGFNGSTNNPAQIAGFLFTPSSTAGQQPLAKRP